MKKIVALVLSLVMVLGLAVTAMAAPAGVEFYGLDADGKWEKDDTITQWIANKGYADLDDVMADDDNFLPCYDLPGMYYIEVPAAAASYKLVYGAKTVYLTEVPENVVKFEAKASALTVVDKDDAVCGDWFVAGLDDEDVYYASYDKKTGLVDKVWVANEKSNTNVLVSGKLVAVDDVTAVVDQAEHAWVGYDVVNYQYTTVKCTECDKVATLYANAEAAGKYAFDTGFGWITAAANGYTAAGAVVETEKVESAETFDAGIAMYVGMSVMAAAGSAVVLKKKD